MSRPKKKKQKEEIKRQSIVSNRNRLHLIFLLLLLLFILSISLAHATTETCIVNGNHQICTVYNDDGTYQGKIDQYNQNEDSKDNHDRR